MTTIHVTEKAIALSQLKRAAGTPKGTYQVSKHCPIAEALTAQFGLSGVVSGWTSLVLRDGDGRNRAAIRPSAAVQAVLKKVILEYDTTGKAAPFSFEAEVVWS